MICGFGIYDGEKGNTYHNNIFYRFWSSMIERCYSEKMLKRNPTYQGTIVCDQWKYYSNFEKWAKENYIEGFNLDKDIIAGDLKIYSPETCCFVPPLINSCILDKNTSNEYPIGVSYIKKNKDGYERPSPYRATISMYGKQVHLKTFKTPEEAHQCWQENKIKYLNELIVEYKNIVGQNVIDGLLRRIDILTFDFENKIITKSINKV